MSRPLPMYLISAWLAIWLIGVPLRNRAVLEALIGNQITILAIVIMAAAAIVLSVKFLQCERAYVDLVLWVLAVQLGYLLTRFLWLLFVLEQPIDYPIRYLLVLGLNLFSVLYLMSPSTVNNVARLRAAIRAEQQHKRQAK